MALFHVQKMEKIKQKHKTNGIILNSCLKAQQENSYYEGKMAEQKYDEKVTAIKSTRSKDTANGECYFFHLQQMDI